MLDRKGVLKKRLIVLLLALLFPAKADALDTVSLKATRIDIVYNNVNFENIKKLEYEKISSCKIIQRGDSTRVILENTEIFPDELLTKKGVIKLIPALISTYASMNTLSLYGGKEDKVLHHTFNYVTAKLTKKPLETFAASSILKELGNDYLLGNGTVDGYDVLANFLGVLQAKITENNEKDLNKPLKNLNKRL